MFFFKSVILFFVGHALIGTVISTHNVILFQECHELCLQTPRCLSYNYEYQSTSSTHVCEINDTTDKMCPGNLARKPGFKYYEEKVRKLWNK